MRLALLMLVVPALAFGQGQDKKEEEKKPQEPARPLILRLDQLPANDRADLTVRETAPPKSDNLPELGGSPSRAYEAAGVRGSGTSAPGSPFPADTQQGSGK